MGPESKLRAALNKLNRGEAQEVIIKCAQTGRFSAAALLREFQLGLYHGYRVAYTNHSDELIVRLAQPQSMAFYSGRLPQQVAMNAPPDLPTRTATEPLIGWRSFALDPHSYMLLSPVRGTRWEGPVLRSTPPQPGEPHYGAGASFSFGIYSYRLPQEYWTGHVVGRVANSGRVIRHESGYRAEICTIQKLYILQSHELSLICYNLLAGGRTIAPLLAKLWNRYQCEIDLDLTELRYHE